MSDRIFERIIDEIREYREFVKVCVLYHSGEPFLSRKFSKFLRTINQIGEIYTKTVSNGMLITQELCDELVLNDLDEIMISLDGVNKHQNDFIRKNCNFDSVISNIKMLHDTKKRFRKKTPMIKICNTQFADKNSLHAIPAFPQFIIDALAEHGEEGEPIIHEFDCQFATTWGGVKFDKALFEIIPVRAWAEESKRAEYYCDNIYSTVTVTAEGDVVPCCLDLTREIVLGNVLTHSIKALWTGERYSELRRQLSEGTLPNLCATCNSVQDEKYVIVFRDNNPLKKNMGERSDISRDYYLSEDQFYTIYRHKDCSSLSVSHPARSCE